MPVKQETLDDPHKLKWKRMFVCLFIFASLGILSWILSHYSIPEQFEFYKSISQHILSLGQYLVIFYLLVKYMTRMGREQDRQAKEKREQNRKAKEKRELEQSSQKKNAPGQ